MIPRIIQLKHIDSKIRNLVVSLGRIPGIETLSNCEGHVYGYGLLAMPVKSGWFHFSRNHEQHLKLVDRFGNYCADSNGLFNLEESKINSSIDWVINSVFGNFKAYEKETPKGTIFWDEWPKQEQELYLQKARQTLSIMHQGWNDMNRIVLDYIKQDLKKDPRTMPYRDPNDKKRFSSFRCCFH